MALWCWYQTAPFNDCEGGCSCSLSVTHLLQIFNCLNATHKGNGDKRLFTHHDSVLMRDEWFLNASRLRMAGTSETQGKCCLRDRGGWGITLGVIRLDWVREQHPSAGRVPTQGALESSSLCPAQPLAVVSQSPLPLPYLVS